MKLQSEDRGWVALGVTKNGILEKDEWVFILEAKGMK